MNRPRVGCSAVTSGSLAPRHGTARPQVTDVGTASNMEGSCEYIQ